MKAVKMLHTLKTAANPSYTGRGSCHRATYKSTVRLRPLIVVCLLLWMPITLFAQKGLHINAVFEQYGKSKNAVMVNMSGEVLNDYDFSLFKSITVKNDPEATTFVRQCLSLDEKGAKKIKQVVANGVVTSIILQLPPVDGGNRLILFNEQIKAGRQFVLIYIESERESDDILKLLLKKSN